MRKMDDVRGRANPETILTRRIRELLRLMRIPHFKHWGGPLSERGIPDIIGILPGGRALYVEVKTPTGRVSPEQEVFLAKARAAGAVALVVRSPKDLLNDLADIGFGPAKDIHLL